MSKRDVDVANRALEAFNRRDVDGLVAQVDPAVVWEEGGVVFPDLPPAYYGPDGVRRWYEEATVEAWESFSADLLETRDDGDGKVVQLFRIRGRGRGSGVAVDLRVVQTITVREGRIFHRHLRRA